MDGARLNVAERLLYRQRIGGGFEDRIVAPNLLGGTATRLPLSDGLLVVCHFVFGGAQGLEDVMRRLGIEYLRWKSRVH